MMDAAEMDGGAGLAALAGEIESLRRTTAKPPVRV